MAGLDEAPGRQHPKYRTRGHLLFACLAWPVSTVMLGGFPFLVATTLASGESRAVEDFWVPIHAVGRWAEPAFSSGFDALAVFGTLIVAVAAITGFSGDWSGLTARARTLFSTLTALAVALLLGVAALTPSVVIASQRSSSQTILLWVTAWGVMLVTLAIAEVLPLRSQVVLARVRSLCAERRAENAGFGIPPLEGSALRPPIGAFVALFGAPLAAWTGFSAVVATGMGAPVPIGALLAFLAYGGFIAMIGWVVGCDGSASRLVRTFSLAVTGAGVAVTVSFAIAISSFSGTISVGLLGMAAASLILLSPQRITRRLPVLGQIQEWRTSQSLRLLRGRSAAMQNQWTRHAATRERPPSLWSRVIRAVTG